MKKIVFVLIAAINLNANAIVTKNCPESIAVEISEFTQIELTSWVTENLAENADLMPAYNYLPQLAAVSDTLVISKKENSRCFYKGQTLSAEIFGTLKENAAQPAQLNVTIAQELENSEYPVDYHISIPLTDVQKDQITLKYPEGYAQVVFYGNYCSYGDCGPGFYNIGQANQISAVVK